MQDDPAKAFDLLYGALREYEATFVDASLKACGFFLLALGWVLTSDKAREFVTESDINRRLAIFGLLLPSIAAIVMATRVIRFTRHLHRELDALQHFPQSYYQYRVITPSFAAAVIGVAISPCIVLIIFLIAMDTKKAEKVAKHECITVVQSGTQRAPTQGIPSTWPLRN